MGWLNQDDIKPYKRLFKQQETKGSLMGRGLNPTEKYKAQGGMGVQYNPYNTWQGGVGFGANVGNFGIDTKMSMYQPYTPSITPSGGGGGGFLSQGFKGMPGLGNILSGVGGIMQGYGAYQQAKGQKKALGHAIGQAKKIPGMIEEGYAPGMERYGNLEQLYGHQGAVQQSLMRNLTGAFNTQMGQVDPGMRKILGQGNVQKGVQAMSQMVPQFAQQQQNIAGTITGMEQAKSQQLIGAHENLAQLEAARKSINPTASAFGSFGASLMSLVNQGGGKVKKQQGNNVDTSGINPEVLQKFYNQYKLGTPFIGENREKQYSPHHTEGSGISPQMLDSLVNRYNPRYESQTQVPLKDESLERQLDMLGLFKEMPEYDKTYDKKAGGGYVSGPHHGAGGVDISPSVEAQGGEFVVNANSYNKHKSLVDAVNMDDNEMTIMNSYFGDKHSAHGNMMQGGGELNSNEMTPYQKYLVVRGNKPSEFSDEHAFNRGLENYLAKKQGGGQYTSKTLYDTPIHSRQVSPTDYGGYDTKLLMSIPADQVGGDEGRRWYLGEAESKLMSMADKKAGHRGRIKMASNPSDSLTTEQAMEMFPDYFGIESEAPVEKQGLLKRIFGKKKQSGGNVMSEGTLINKVINKTYGI